MLFDSSLTKIIPRKNKSLNEILYRTTIEAKLADLTKIVQDPKVSIKIYALSLKTLITKCTTMTIV
jgi:hypothetical protein